MVLAIAWLLSLCAFAFIHDQAHWLTDTHFWSLLVLNDQKAIIALLLLLPLLAALLAYLPAVLTGLPEQVSRHRYSIVLATIAMLGLLARYAYQGLPLSMDEYSAWFQAHAFARGELGGYFPPPLIDHLLSPVFRNYFLSIDQHNGFAISTYWPGFALLLTPFAWLGIPWLCNPVLVGCTLLLGWHLGRDLFGNERAAGWVMLLMLANPAIMLNGISFYSMPAHLLCNTLFVWLLLKGEPRRYLCAGLVGGIALSLHNPFPHLVFVLPLLPWIARKVGLKQILLLSAGYAVTALPLVTGWVMLKAPVVAATLVIDPATGLLPTTTLAALPPSTLTDTAVRTLSSLFTRPTEYLLLARNAALIKLWAWSSPVLICLAVYGAAITRISLLRYLTACALFTLLAYYLIRFDQGLGWGYRYFHPAYIALPLLATAALCRLESVGMYQEQWRRLAPALALSGLCILVPLHALQMQERVAGARSQMPPQVKGRGLYLFNGTGYCQGLRCDLLQNDPFLNGNVYLINNSRYAKVRDEDLLAHFPGARLSGQNEYGRSYTLPDDWRSTSVRIDAQR